MMDPLEEIHERLERIVLWPFRLVWRNLICRHGGRHTEAVSCIYQHQGGFSDGYSDYLVDVDLFECQRCGKRWSRIDGPYPVD